MVWTAWRTGKAEVAGGAAWAVVITHIAMTGQSVQVPPFCSSGQHGISAAIEGMSAIEDMSVIPSVIMPAMEACMDACMATGAATGATASPTAMAIASNRVMNRRKSMVLFCHGGRGRWKGHRFTFVAG
jgi:hypothetical protein